MTMTLTYCHHEDGVGLGVGVLDEEVVLLGSDSEYNTLTFMSTLQAEDLGFALVEAANTVAAQINADTVAVTDINGGTTYVRKADLRAAMAGCN